MPLDASSLSLVAKTIRILSAEAVQKANSGHPGMPMGTADMASVLWTNFLRFNPRDPEWVGRDRFVLSAGHGSMLLYSLLHLYGFDLPLEQIKQFRQWESKTPGHPEFGVTPGVETTTGPLGQGFANGVGLALSERLLADRYCTDLFGNRVYGIVSDGDLMEGVASEAASLAGHLKLGNLNYLYDDNHISIGGRTDVCFTESVPDRFRAYGWHVQEIDGHDLEAVYESLENAVAENGMPSIICARTTIGLGSPNKADTSGVHGSPLGDEELALVKEGLGWEESEPFSIPDSVQKFCAEVVEAKTAEYELWNAGFENWKEENAEKASKFADQRERKIPEALEAELLSTLGGEKKEATRATSGAAIQVIAKHLPFFLGGSADLEPSNKTLINDEKDVTGSDFGGRNLRFGVREHAMGSMVNGLAYTGQWIPYGATFLVFSDYMRPAIRLAALSHLQSLFIFTHDSFWVGEDGPTHEPIEHIQALRVIPNLLVFRPADGMETAFSYLQALEAKHQASTLLFTRQGLPTLKRPEGFDPALVRKGAYVLSGEEVTDKVLVATGSEVWVAQEAAELLAQDGHQFRVVSMPCQELFLGLSEEEQASIIPPDATTVSIEAGTTFGWGSIVGDKGFSIGIDHYGASAPGELLAEKFGFTPEAVRKRVAEYLRSFA